MLGDHLPVRQEVRTVADVSLVQEDAAVGQLERLESGGKSLEPDRREPGEDRIRAEELEILG